MWDGVQTRIIAANGIEFEVAEAGSGPNLALCLHGFPEHAIAWRHQVAPLLARGYRVWMPNLRGYGGSSRPLGIKAYDIAVLIEDVVGLVQAAKAESVVLIGHDWGAVIAWYVAMRRPEVIQRLVIMNVPHPACFAREARINPEQRRKSWYIALFQIPWLPEFGMRRNKAQVVRRAFLDTAVNKANFPDEILSVYVINALQPGALTAMINYYRAAGRGGGFGRQEALGYPMIEVPTLMIWGEQDMALTKATTIGTQDYVRDLTLRYVPMASHWVQQDAPDQVNAMLGAWLDGAVVPEVVA